MDNGVGREGLLSFSATGTEAQRLEVERLALPTYCVDRHFHFAWGRRTGFVDACDYSRRRESPWRDDFVCPVYGSPLPDVQRAADEGLLFIKIVEGAAVLNNQVSFLPDHLLVS